MDLGSASFPKLALRDVKQHTFDVKMASILSLPDDCLHKIVSFIEDPSSFKSITLTCQRFLQVTKNTRSVLNSNLLRAKAEYLIKYCIVKRRRTSFLYHRSPTDVARRAEFDGNDLIALLRGCARLTTTKSTFTYDKVVDVWQSNGPVAAKLFTLVRNLELESHSEKKNQTTFGESRRITLHLPSSEKTMVIQTQYLGDYSIGITPRLNIQITCGDLTVKSEGLSRLALHEGYLSWKREEVKRAVEPMKPVAELLQKELGETVPPITDDFFLWLCCFFPDKTKNLNECNKLSFKDDTRNTKPTHASVQTAIDEFHKELQFGSSLEKLLTTWNDKTRGKSKYTEITATIRQLSKRSETKILERLGEDASTFYSIANYHDLKPLPNKVLLDLFLRTSLEGSTFQPATTANKNVESRIFFKCLGGKAMKVCGYIYGKVIPIWERVQVEFTLPDGKVLKLDGPFNLEMLSPVTHILRECSKFRTIDNFCTAVYFLHALELSSASDIAFNSFDMLIPLQRFPESEEEQDDWDWVHSFPRGAMRDEY